MPQIHGALASGCPWYMNGQQQRTFQINNGYVLCGEEIDADRVAIVDIIPEILLMLRRLLWGESIEMDNVVFLTDTENDDASFAIGHGAVGLPETTGKTAFG